MMEQASIPCGLREEPIGDRFADERLNLTIPEESFLTAPLSLPLTKEESKLGTGEVSTRSVGN